MTALLKAGDLVRYSCLPGCACGSSHVAEVWEVIGDRVFIDLDLGPLIHPEITGRILEPKRQRIPSRVKVEVAIRDHGDCVYCGMPTSEDNRVFDHVMPVCMNGESTKWNLVLACWGCNSKKRGRPAWPAACGHLIYEPEAECCGHSGCDEVFWDVLRQHWDEDYERWLEGDPL